MNIEILDIVERHKTPCKIGKPSNTTGCPIGCSKKGGFPDISDGFQWPSFRGKYLSFIAQVELKYFISEESSGTLQFYWSQRNWGGSIKDRGSFCVIHQRDLNHRLEIAPKSEYKSLGFIKRTHSPTIWKEECLEFHDSFCLPPIDRLDYDWGCDKDDLYYQEIEKMSGFFRIGGPPNPVQNDDMEEDCVRFTNIGTKDSWKLLLEIDSQSDMMWGDAGKLYWFIHEADLENRDFSRVWMQMQCH